MESHSSHNQLYSPPDPSLYSLVSSEFLIPYQYKQYLQNQGNPNRLIKQLFKASEIQKYQLAKIEQIEMDEWLSS